MMASLVNLRSGGPSSLFVWETRGKDFLENNAASFSLQTFDPLLVLKTTAVPGDVTVLQKR